MNKLIKSFKDNYELILVNAVFITGLCVALNNDKLDLVNGVPTTPDVVYDANNDGKLDAFYLQRTHGILQGTYPEGGSILFLDGNQLEKTVDGYKMHAKPRFITGSSFIPHAGYKLPLSLIVGEFDGKKGIDARVIEYSSLVDVSHTTELNNLKLPYW
jgi:hypothetical protein